MRRMLIAILTMIPLTLGVGVGLASSSAAPAGAVGAAKMQTQIVCSGCL